MSGVQRYVFLSEISKFMIKNIIFDLGGVLLEIYPERSIMAFKSLLSNDKKNFDVFFSAEKIFEKMEIISDCSDFFASSMNSQLQKPLSNEQIFEYWNLLLGDFIPETIEAVQKLKSNYRLFLLSNTNNLHFDVYSSKFLQEFGFDMCELFEQCYFSHKIGLRKPDLAIFHKVLNENNLVARETLFLDDMTYNREAAEQLFIQTLPFTTNDRVTLLPEFRALIGE